MPECGPPSSWRRRPECECLEKAVRRSAISSVAICLLQEMQAGHPDFVAGRQSADEITNHLITSASQLYMGGHVRRIALCQMMPRSCAPRAAQRRMGECPGGMPTDIYQLTGRQQQHETNCLLQKSASSSRFLTFWDHNKIEDGQSQEGKFYSRRNTFLGPAQPVPTLQIVTRCPFVCEQEPWSRSKKSN